MKFQDWINQKYIEWRGDSRNSVRQFAQFLKIDQATMSAWINGTRKGPKSSKLIGLLFDHYGNEVYDVLGYPQPEINQVDISSLPEELQSKIRSAVSEIDSQIKELGLDPESPEAGRVIRKSFEKYGFDVKTNRNSG